jgi:hypothetical protein
MIRIFGAHCHFRTISVAAITQLFDHLVGQCEQVRRDGDFQRSCGLEIDDKIELGWLFDGDIARLYPVQKSSSDRVMSASTGCGHWPCIRFVAMCHEPIYGTAANSATIPPPRRGKRAPSMTGSRPDGRLNEAVQARRENP